MEGRGGQFRWVWLLVGGLLLGLLGLIATSTDRLDTMRVTALQNARTALDSQGMLTPHVEVRDGTMVVTGAAASQAEKQAICGAVTDSLAARQMLGVPGVIARVACDVTAPGDDASGAGAPVADAAAGATGGADAAAIGAAAPGSTAGAAAGASAGAAGSTGQAAAADCQTRLTSVAATGRVTFALNGNEISGGTTMLDQIADVAKSCRQFAIEVGGHTDRRGGDAINVPLSQKRAEAVRAYLVGKGVDPGQLTARGYGSSRPVDPSATADDEPRNRRTEFTITALD